MTWRKGPEVSATRGLFERSDKKAASLIFTLLAALISGGASCTAITQRRDVRPLVLRDVPAQRLAYRFEPDVAVPPELKTEDADDRIEAIQLDFNTRRQDDALVRTVRSPDGQRALVLYGTADEPSQEFHLDLYSSDGRFLRNLTPPDLACVFPETVTWSPDGNFITFIARKAERLTLTPTRPGASVPEAPEAGEATPLPSVAPAFPPVALFSTEQIYICNRDGYDLRPLTSREGLIYFYAVWAPDNHALVAMACKESEWEAREREFKLAMGRPRLLTVDGKERLLDDELTEALPVWCPDSSKVATALDTEVKIYDAASNTPTQARIRLADALIAASRIYEERNSDGKKKNDTASGSNAPESSPEPSDLPASLNPAIRLEWTSPEKLFFETAYVRLLRDGPITTFQRWHLVILSSQAAVLK
ncbi:MAG: TolB family protein [Pyrinomonadaceae bacterium]